VNRELKRIKRILIVGGVAFCADTAWSWHDWRAAAVNAAGVAVLVAAVLVRRHGRRTAGAR